MRVLLMVLAALLLLSPTAQATSAVVVVESVGKPGMALTIDALGEAAGLRLKSGGPDQAWTIFPVQGGVVVSNWEERGCLTAYSPEEVLLLECIGTPSQAWTWHVLDGSTHVLESVAYPGQCLTAVRPLRPVEVTPCSPNSRSQRWKW